MRFWDNIKKQIVEDDNERLDRIALAADTKAEHFVWCDPDNYTKVWKRLAAIAVAAVVVGLAGYLPFMKYAGAEIFGGVLCAITAGILLFVFRRRIANNMATFVEYDHRLYRLQDANRGITRLAADNTQDAPYFESDFRRARKGNTCWLIEKVTLLKKTKSGYCVYCRVTEEKSGKQAQKKFYLEKGYLNMDRLIATLGGLQETAPEQALS